MKPHDQYHDHTPVYTPALIMPTTDTEADVLVFDSDSESDSDSSDYLSFEESENGEIDHENISTSSKTSHKADKEARERERQLVLEAAGLVVQQDVGLPPPRPPRPRGASSSSSASKTDKRRPAPAAPRRTPSSVYKELPPVPSPNAEPVPESALDELGAEVDSASEVVETEMLTHEARLDDAFARYESFKNGQANQLGGGGGGLNNNRLSVVSTDSSITMPASPTTTISSVSMSQKDTIAGSSSEGRYAHFRHFLTSSGSRVVGSGEGGERRRSASVLNISAPIMSNSSSHKTTPDGPTRANSPSFGMSWASLVDKNALDGIPPGERKRQEVRVELFLVWKEIF
jgi:hypothetical protein